VWPWKLARMSAVKPSMSMKTISEPAATSACAITEGPWMLAQMSAVQP
jgi:hypothetical protein